MTHRSWIAAAALGGVLVGTALTAAGAPPATPAPAASTPPSYVCTAVEIPVATGRRAGDPLVVHEQVLPPGYRPVGATPIAQMVDGDGLMLPYVVACREQ